MRNKTSLKEYANEIFDPEVAKAVELMLDEYPEPVSRQHNLDSKNKTFGFTTFFLGNIFYKQLKYGKYTTYANIKVLPGKANFKFVKNASAPFFSYVTSSGKIITPGSTDSNLGSIPQFFQMFSVLTPSYYSLAYLIHDWLFKSHQEGSKDFTFEQTAEILAEGIKTLMEVGYYDDDGKLIQLEQDEDALFLIYLAVLTPFARAIWDKKE